MIKQRKTNVIFDLLERQAHVAHRASEVFLKMASEFSKNAQFAAELDSIESEGDELTHKLQNSIATVFITPLDKEDLRELSQALDDVTDLIEAAAARAELYSLTEPRPELMPMVKVLVQLTKHVHSAIKELNGNFAHSASLRSTLLEIHTLENENDREYRSALRNLFHEPNPDALYVMKWKELFERIEAAADKCETIAALLGTIQDKYS